MSATSATLSDRTGTPRVRSTPPPVPTPHSAVQPDLFDTVHKVIDANVWHRRGPRIAALAVLAQPAIAEALNAEAKLAAVADLHTPRTWAGGTTTVCVECNQQFPCRSVEAMR